jgi:hypothetical protein
MLLTSQYHLSAKHNVQERHEYQFALIEAGYDPSTYDVVGPICGEKTGCTAAFERHLQDMHSFVDEDHFFGWFDSISAATGQRLTVDAPYILQQAVLAGEARFASIDCTFCFFKISGMHVNPKTILSVFDTQHQGLFIKNTSLYEHHEAILKHMPEFGMHLFSTIYVLANKLPNDRIKVC